MSRYLETEEFKHYKRELGKHVKSDVDCRHIIEEQFAPYRRETNQNSKADQNRLAREIRKWTGVDFTSDAQDVFSRQSEGDDPLAEKTSRGWAVLYSLRFFDNPDRPNQNARQTSALERAETVERHLLTANSKRPQTYQTITGRKLPPHPDERRRAEGASTKLKQLPARFFEFKQAANFQKERQEFLKVKATFLKPGSHCVSLVAAVTGAGGYAATAKNLVSQRDVKTSLSFKVPHGSAGQGSSR